MYMGPQESVSDTIRLILHFIVGRDLPPTAVLQSLNFLHRFD